MVALPQVESPTVAAIYKTYEDKNVEQKPRMHLGGSLIGKECGRELWYEFRWCASGSRFSGRILRLFETGFLEEPRVVRNLRAIGATVHEVDPRTGKQFRYMEHGGHFGGSIDGALVGIPEAPKRWHLLEIKTHNTRSFKAIKTKGIEEAKPVHWHQMQTYMGMADLRRALYFAVQKDTDEIYVERITFERSVYKANQGKALRIIESREPLTKVADDADAFACKWCDFKETCHGCRTPPVSCRTCAHATPLVEGEDGRWRCEYHGKELTNEEQVQACDEHLFIPALVPYAHTVDSGEGWITYALKDRAQEFTNCGASGFPAADTPHYSSQELAALVAPDVIGNPAIESVREVFGGEIVASEQRDGSKRE